MQIFVLDLDPKQNAIYHNNSHCVKMVVESAQILSSALRLHGIQSSNIYKSTHKNNPLINWAAKTTGNFIWLFNLGVELSNEYSFRYDRLHATNKIFHEIKVLLPKSKITRAPITEFFQNIPDQYKIKDNVVEAYRSFYRAEKSHIAHWKKRNVPDWWWQND